MTWPGDDGTVEWQGSNPCNGGGKAEDGKEGGKVDGKGGKVGGVEGEGGGHPLLLLLVGHLHLGRGKHQVQLKTNRGPNSQAWTILVRYCRFVNDKLPFIW